MKMHPSPTRAQEYQMDDPCYHIGGVVTQIDIKIKDPISGISRIPTQDSSGTTFNWYQIGIYKWGHSNNQVMSIKMQDSSLNHLPQMHTFASMRSTPFMEIDDKGGEVGTKICKCIMGRSRSWTWTKMEQH